ncbi:hypothetical protein E4U57_006412 [Claviceps arundinis]|uniref:Uncharacterized protein n=1 Tax=Claviceps arundinis TaxID=1623583 RepID=A0A9P7MUQ3_9HYPO|nr:hypothetical protein E4U57_006412 [Claviceps arundinis]KAG5969784.1 hypothetical protein E4U56_008076 [Claviceps arundinis]
MLKVTSVFIAALAAIGPAVQAASCTPGLNYCGLTLTQYGWDSSRGSNTLADDGLFHCVSSNRVKPIAYCENKCRDAGGGKSDYCN